MTDFKRLLCVFLACMCANAVYGEGEEVVEEVSTPEESTAPSFTEQAQEAEKERIAKEQEATRAQQAQAAQQAIQAQQAQAAQQAIQAQQEQAEEPEQMAGEFFGGTKEQEQAEEQQAQVQVKTTQFEEIKGVPLDKQPATEQPPAEQPVAATTAATPSIDETTRRNAQLSFIFRNQAISNQQANAPTLSSPSSTTSPNQSQTVSATQSNDTDSDVSAQEVGSAPQIAKSKALTPEEVNEENPFKLEQLVEVQAKIKEEQVSIKKEASTFKATLKTKRAALLKSVINSPDNVREAVETANTSITTKVDKVTKAINVSSSLPNISKMLNDLQTSLKKTFAPLIGKDGVLTKAGGSALKAAKSFANSVYAFIDGMRVHVSKQARAEKQFAALQKAKIRAQGLTNAELD